MTPQERSLIDDLANKIAQANVGQKDTEAESLIQQEIGSRPDSLYKLVQTVLVQNMALEQAKAQIAGLQQKAASAQSHPSGPTSFLGSLFGSHSAPAPPPPQPAPPGTYAPGPAAPAAAGGGSSFLRSAATTAAGVAAGALAFEGIESLLHGGLGGGGFGHQSGMGSGFLGGAGQPGETVINNYYDSPDDQTDSPDNSDTDDSQADDAGDDASDDSSDDSDTGDSSDGGGDDFV
ncbi:MAG: DUF2076 domain-containing protein [Bryobacteraceae bacterium]